MMLPDSCTDVWCTMHKSMILFHDPDDAWIWGGVCIYDAVLFGDQPTNERTDKAILGVGCIHLWSLILDYAACVYVYFVYVYFVTNGRTNQRTRRFYIYTWSWYMRVWCIYNVPRSLTLMHVCMMHISMILDLDPEACMYVWCIYLWYGWNFVTDERTDGRTRRV